MKKMLIVLFSLTALSCQKELQTSLIETPKTSENVIIPESFDWENADYVPAPSGSNILVPWAFGASRAFPAEFLDDVQQTDGWELVYSTFSSAQLPSTDAYVIFYNRYRGLLRGYFYNRKNENPSTYITHSLQMSPLIAGSNLFAFAGSEIVDIGASTNLVSVVQPYQTGPAGTWHAAEFELAYDPLATQRQANQFFFTWAINNKAISQIVINGQSSGTINGTIAQPNPPTNWGSTLIKGALNVIGTGGAGLITSGGEILEKITEGIQKGTQGEVSNIVSGIFGGKADSSYSYVNLKTSTDYTFTGSSETDVLLSSASLVVPGTIGQQNVAGYTALRNEPYGIFYLDNVPKVTVVQQIDTEEWYNGPPANDIDPRAPDYGYYQGWYPAYFRHFRISINESSYNIIFNPAVVNSNINGVTIHNITRDIVIPAYQQPMNTGINYLNTVVDRRPYTILLNTTIFNTDIFGTYDGSSSALPSSFNPQSTYLRISFDVVPNNGAQKTKIIKTFRVSL